MSDFHLIRVRESFQELNSQLTGQNQDIFSHLASPQYQQYFRGSSLNSDSENIVRLKQIAKIDFEEEEDNLSNVFYQDSPTQARRKTYSLIKNICGIIFVFLLISFLLIYSIPSFNGLCPRNAVCKVTIRCYDGYEYDRQINECVISQQFRSQPQKLGLKTINQLKQIYGNSDCYVQPQLKSKHIDQMVIGLPKQSKYIIRLQIEKFFSNIINQNQHNFMFKYDKIMVRSKSFSFSCNTVIYFKSDSFKILFSGIAFLLCGGATIYLNYSQSEKGRSIYKQIKEKIEKQAVINLNYEKKFLKKKYGQITNQVWKEIQSLMSRDRDIQLISSPNLYCAKMSK